MYVCLTQHKSVWETDGMLVTSSQHHSLYMYCIDQLLFVFTVIQSAGIQTCWLKHELVSKSYNSDDNITMTIYQKIYGKWRHYKTLYNYKTWCLDMLVTTQLCAQINYMNYCPFSNIYGEAFISAFFWQLIIKQHYLQFMPTWGRWDQAVNTKLTYYHLVNLL